MGSSNHANDLERLASDASLRALAEQESALRDLRDRAGTLLAATALTISFLGARALDRDGMTVIAWLSIGAFAISVLATLYVLSPKPGLTFTLSGPEIYARLWRVRRDPAEIHYRLACWMAVFRARNQTQLERLYAGYRLAVVSLATQLALWIVQLTTILDGAL